jgi:hypothetical protein
VVTWAQFEGGAPPLAALARERFEGPGLVLVGTLRRGGWPRISPVEPLIVEGQLYLGMMWQSKKALDLQGDPRCVVHSLVTNRDGAEGDVKVYGRAVEISDPEERHRYGAALFDRIGWRPEGPFHLFAVDVEEVGYFRVEGDAHRVWHWRPGQTLGALETHPGAAG